MANVNGEWIIMGTDSSDPYCLHTPDQAIDYIKQIGFLPLFQCSVPALSLENRTVPDYWWTEIEAKDPWEWRRIIAASGEVAYGKFFRGRAGFISLDWFPYFANWRRDGYDYDAAWDDGKMKFRQKNVMDCFEEKDEYYSNELKRASGLIKEEAKHFDPTLIELQEKAYVCIKDFRQRLNKKGMPYGWPLTVYSTPENMWGRDLVTSAYKEEPEESRERIYNHLLTEYPVATTEQIEALFR